MHQHNEWHSFYFEYGSRMYWFELDLDRYTRALDRITNTGTEVIQEWEAREKAVKESGCVTEIANCWLTPLYFQRSEPTDESWYYVKVNMPNRPAVKDTFTANQLTSSAEFKKRLLHIAKGAVYTGSTKQLDKFIQMRLPEIKEVKTQNFIGYNKDYSAWLFNRVAVCDGRLYEMNDEDYFEINHASVKSLSLTPVLDLNPKLNEFTTGWIDDIWTAFGEKGYVALAFWLGSLFAEQIRERDKSFPFLEIVGEPGTGKSTLIEFLWKLAGREEYEGFDPSKSTAAARGRNFAQVSNLPVVLIEGDRTTDNAKQRAFDWDELKSLYNGRASRAVGIKSNNNETYEPPFREVSLSHRTQIQTAVRRFWSVLSISTLTNVASPFRRDMPQSGLNKSLSVGCPDSRYWRPCVKKKLWIRSAGVTNAPVMNWSLMRIFAIFVLQKSRAAGWSAGCARDCCTVAG